MPWPRAGSPAAHRRPRSAATVSARVDASQHADRAFHHLRRRQHAVGVPDGVVHQRHHRDMRPAADPLRALHQFGRIAAEYRGGDRRIAAEPDVDAAAPLAGGGELGKLGSAARSAGADTRARLLPSAAEHIGALAAPCWCRPAACNPRPPSSCRSTPAPPAWHVPARLAHTPRAVVWRTRTAAAPQAARVRAGWWQRMVSSPDRTRWAAAGRPPRSGWTACRSRCCSAGLPPARPPHPTGSSSPN